jgi:hypothetical protein
MTQRPPILKVPYLEAGGIRKILEGDYLDHWTKFSRNFGDKPDFAFTKRIVAARKIAFSKTGKRQNRPAPNWRGDLWRMRLVRSKGVRAET